MTAEELEAIRQELSNASDECGDLDFFTPTGRMEDGSWSVQCSSEDDAVFLAQSKQNITSLLAHIEDALARIGELEAMLKRLEFTEDEAALLKDQP